MTAKATARRSITEVMLVNLARDGRVANPAVLDRIEEASRSATDCFVFCHGWLYDEAEARREGERFFALLESALAPLDERVVPLRVTLHWPSRPFTNGASDRKGGEFLDMLARVPETVTWALLSQLCESEVPAGPEEEAELEALKRSLRGSRAAAPSRWSPVEALSFWMMKRRAGQVGERFGSEHLARISRGIRTHVVGHSFGGVLASSAVLGGAELESLTLLLAAFSAYGFARDVPGCERSGRYHPVVAERRVKGPITVLHSRHDQALSVLYPLATGGSLEERATAPGRGGRVREVVAASAIGFLGARGVGAPELSLLDVQRTGLARVPVVNVDGSRVVKAREPLVGAHRDIFHPEIATLVAMAAGLIAGGPDGARARPVDSRVDP